MLQLFLNRPASWTLHGLRLTGLLAALSLLPACSPTYDWRDVRGTEAPYTVLLPAKPSRLARPVNLGGLRTSMTMTAAEVDGVTFAVGTAELPDAAQAQAALLVMQETLVKNIGGIIRHEKRALGANLSRIDLEAGPVAGVKGAVLHARLIARERRVYQAIVVGKEKSVRADAVDVFLTSFKID